MTRTRLVSKALLVSALTGTAAIGLILGPSNIDPVNKWSWGENIGHMNWRDADSGNQGVVVNADHLEGHIWAENIGWINVGNGGGPYTNTDDTNYGVNILGDGSLEGYAWAENVGWINFDTSATTNPAEYDAGAERFRGYAWGENIGWINLDDATHYVATTAGATCQDDDDCDDSSVCTADTCDPGDPGADPFGCVYASTARPFGDVTVDNQPICPPGPGDAVSGCGSLVELPDIVYVLNAFSQGLAWADCYPNADLMPCGGDGDVSLPDITGVLNAFAGNPDCPSQCPCP